MRNLTELALKNRTLIWFFIAMTFASGVFSYFKLGRMEDPSFTIREMVITTAWPGATASEVEEQVTDKLERKIQDTPHIDHITSESRAGVSIIHVILRDELDKDSIRPLWRDVRNFCEGIKDELPTGVVGPYYNDRFDDVFGSIYAVTGDGYSYEEMRVVAEKIRRQLLTLDDVQKIELIGVQDEKIYIELDREKIFSLGISIETVAAAIKNTAQMLPTGSLETDSDNVSLRLTGSLTDLDELRSLPISLEGRTLRLSDIATIERRYVDPADAKMFFNGEPAVGVAVSMQTGGNILTLGEELRQDIQQIQTELPAGLEIHQVSDQPTVVEDSINDFVRTLIEAIVIVLAVSFLSLGYRTGLVVALCIPLVLAGVFALMYALSIDLHKVSLGALIISLGLLVDDAIIAVEMMSVQLERGLSRFEAACYAFTSTAKPMLTGTLITCAGFIPVAFSKDIASEFCSALFPVISIALLLSWIVSVMVAPLYGTYLISTTVKKDATGHINPYQNRFYQKFRQLLIWCMKHQKTVLTGTLLLFILSIALFPLIRQDFFPPSLRPEIMISFELPEGASQKASEEQAKKFAAFLDNNPDLVASYSYYVGDGAPRFVLTVSPESPATNKSQFVIVSKGTDEREKLTALIQEELADNFPAVRSRLSFIQTGPPADYPIMLRVSGYDKDMVKAIAAEAAALLAKDGNRTDVHLDWQEQRKVLKLELDLAKLHSMGLSKSDVAQTIYTELNGGKVAELYTGDRTLDIELRLSENDRADLSQLGEIPIYLGSAGYVPLNQIAKLSFAAEDGLIKRWNLQPTATVVANIRTGTPTDETLKAYNALKDIRGNLPFGYSITPGGSLEDSNKSTSHLLIPVPAMVFIILTVLMFQLRSVKDAAITLLTAPLGIIGVTFGMLLTNSAMGFVAILGVLALSGMIIRNSVILIDQIQSHLARGETEWEAIIDSAVLRFRPIMLTAAAAILGMLPLMRSVFWGPMATAIASGLIVATILTLLVLPVLYAAIYRVKSDEE